MGSSISFGGSIARHALHMALAADSGSPTAHGFSCGQQGIVDDLLSFQQAEVVVCMRTLDHHLDHGRSSANRALSRYVVSLFLSVPVCRGTGMQHNSQLQPRT